eukprot:g14257.t1
MCNPDEWTLIGGVLVLFMGATFGLFTCAMACDQVSAITSDQTLIEQLQVAYELFSTADRMIENHAKREQREKALREEQESSRRAFSRCSRPTQFAGGGEARGAGAAGEGPSPAGPAPRGSSGSEEQERQQSDVRFVPSSQGQGALREEQERQESDGHARHRVPPELHLNGGIVDVSHPDYNPTGSSLPVDPDSDTICAVATCGLCGGSGTSLNSKPKAGCYKNAVPVVGGLRCCYFV